jgi:hypothetical protein
MSATKLVVRSHTTRVRLLEVVKSKSMYHSLDASGLVVLFTRILLDYTAFGMETS